MKTMMLGDLHIHSNFSDGKLSIPEIVDFYGQRGFGTIAITDHICEEDTLIGRSAAYLGQCLTRAKHVFYQEILKTEIARAWDQYEMIVIPGYEISKNSIVNHRSSHVLALGITEWLDASGDILDVVQRAKKMGAVTVAAHPVPTRKFEKQTLHLWDRREEFRGILDAWEVASGPHLFQEVIAERLPKLATSDFHRPQQIEAWKTIFECEKSAEAILESVRNQTHLHFAFYSEGTQNEWNRRSQRRPLGRRNYSFPLGSTARV